MRELALDQVQLPNVLDVAVAIAAIAVAKTPREAQAHDLGVVIDLLSPAVLVRTDEVHLPLHRERAVTPGMNVEGLDGVDFDYWA